MGGVVAILYVLVQPSGTPLTDGGRAFTHDRFRAFAVPRGKQLFSSPYA